MNLAVLTVCHGNGQEEKRNAKIGKAETRHEFHELARILSAEVGGAARERMEDRKWQGGKWQSNGAMGVCEFTSQCIKENLHRRKAHLVSIGLFRSGPFSKLTSVGQDIPMRNEPARLPFTA